MKECNNGGCTRPVYRGTECYRCWCGTKWDSMKQRTENRNGHYPQWEGVPLTVTRREFIEWAQQNQPPEDMGLPSIDRIVGHLGYSLGNIQWMESRQNSRGGAKNIPLSHRKCPRCETVLELSSVNFHRNRKNPLGYQTYCKPCRSGEG